MEYIGVVSDAERDKLIEELNKHCEDIIREATENQIKVFRKICSYDEANE